MADVPQPEENIRKLEKGKNSPAEQFDLLKHSVSAGSRPLASGDTPRQPKSDGGQSSSVDADVSKLVGSAIPERGKKDKPKKIGHGTLALLHKYSRERDILFGKNKDDLDDKRENKRETGDHTSGGVMEVHLLDPQNVAWVKVIMLKYISLLDKQQQQMLAPIRKNMLIIDYFHNGDENSLVDTGRAAQAWKDFQTQISSRPGGVDLTDYLRRLMDDTDTSKTEVQNAKKEVYARHLEDSTKDKNIKRDVFFRSNVMEYLKTFDRKKFDVAIQDLQSAHLASRIQRIEEAGADAAEDIQNRQKELSGIQYMLLTIHALKSRFESAPGDQFVQSSGAWTGRIVSSWNEIYCLSLEFRKDSAVRRAWDVLCKDDSMKLPEEYRIVNKVKTLGLDKINENIEYIKEEQLNLGDNEKSYQQMEQVKGALQSFVTDYFNVPWTERAKKISVIAQNWRTMVDVFDRTTDETLQAMQDDLIPEE